MKRKKPMAIVLLAALLCIAAGDQPVAEVGRFQIVPARLFTITKGGQTTVDTIYRIDTSTGTTWRLISRVVDLENGQTVLDEHWQKVLEYQAWREAWSTNITSDTEPKNTNKTK